MDLFQVDMREATAPSRLQLARSGSKVQFTYGAPRLPSERVQAKVLFDYSQTGTILVTGSYLDERLEHAGPVRRLIGHLVETGQQVEINVYEGYGNTAILRMY